MPRRLARATLLFLIQAVAFAAIGSTPPAFASGDRLVVNVPEPFQVSGRMFPAGPVTLRHLGDYTPSTAIDRLNVANGCIGMMLAERETDEPGDLLAPSLVFERDAAGHLVLVGYTTGDTPDGRLYLFRAPGTSASRARAVLVASR